ncbi:MAG: protein arginine kinase [Phycisphaerales bacterium]|nr:protein arginine kinase [Phycisphaerales bacterium]
MTIDDLLQSSGEWLAGGGPMGDVVISSRVRLARNVEGFPFLSRATAEQRRNIEQLLFQAIHACDFGRQTFYVNIEKSEPVDRQLLVERHLISRQHADGEGCRGVAISPTETLSLMINEEDHLRMQVLRRGMNLDEAWNEIMLVDRTLEPAVDFAFHKQYGYLTACPTNVGTGLRVSVMLHLPALKLTNELEKMFRAARDMRLAVRGLYGEGTEAIGDFFQVSNQITLGQSEEEILDSFKMNVIPSIVNYERQARTMLKTDKSAALQDRVWRALGLLQNARAISTDEALYLLSHLRLGIVLECVKHIDLQTISELFIATQSAHLQKRSGHLLDDQGRSVARAELIRDRLARYRPGEN